MKKWLYGEFAPVYNRNTCANKIRASDFNIFHILPLLFLRRCSLWLVRRVHRPRLAQDITIIWEITEKVINRGGSGKHSQNLLSPINVLSPIKQLRACNGRLAFLCGGKHCASIARYIEAYKLPTKISVGTSFEIEGGYYLRHEQTRRTREC